MTRRRDIALVLTCEHAGNMVPARFRALFAPHRSLLQSHRGWDPGALALARVLARGTGAPLILTQVTRLLVECNRSPNHPSLFSAISRGLDDATRRQVLELYYIPHRERVREAIGAALSRHRRVLHVGVHTFTPVLDGEVRTADVGLLYDPRRVHEKAFCVAWARALHETEPLLRVRRNYPYKGASDGLTTALRREFAASEYLGIELEVNQALAAGDDSIRRTHTRRALTRSLCGLLEISSR